MKKFFEEFKKFISRGNVIDLAVGVIIGGAFTAIVTAFTNGILKPIINFLLSLITGGNEASDIYTFLKVVRDGTGSIDMSASIYIDWGALISSVVDFLLVALILFLVIKAMNAAKELTDKDANLEKIISLKNSKGMKLNRKEQAYVDKKKAEAEAALEAAKKAEEEANKLTKTEDLLTQIKNLLEKK